MLTGILLANGNISAAILSSLFNENLVKEGERGLPFGICIQCLSVHGTFGSVQTENLRGDPDVLKKNEPLQVCRNPIGQLHLDVTFYFF